MLIEWLMSHWVLPWSWQRATWPTERETETDGRSPGWAKHCVFLSSASGTQVTIA
jgi:hypothetical protein